MTDIFVKSTLKNDVAMWKNVRVKFGKRSMYRHFDRGLVKEIECPVCYSTIFVRNYFLLTLKRKLTLKHINTSLEHQHVNRVTKVNST